MNIYGCVLIFRIEKMEISYEFKIFSLKYMNKSCCYGVKRINILSKQLV